MTRSAVLFATGLSAALLAGCSVGGSDRVGGERDAPPRVLTLLNPFTGPDEFSEFVDEVARLSDGALKIRIIDAGYADRPDFQTLTIRDMLNGRRTFVALRVVMRGSVSCAKARLNSQLELQ